MRRLAQKWIGLGMLLLQSVSASVLADERAAIGEATLVIGASVQVHADGKQQRIERGTTIYVGDRVETRDGGHVHIRFVDGGFVSVRPRSRLLIEAYAHDRQHTDKSAIKFKLERGVMRSITGAWGEADREKFRLNTPIAAIGVRGTDFTVQAHQDRLLAAVHSGAIVVAPLGEGCRADALGACHTQHARLLAADMGNVMLELQRRQHSPRLIPLNDVLIQGGLRFAPQIPLPDVTPAISPEPQELESLPAPSTTERSTPSTSGVEVSTDNQATHQATVAPQKNVTILPTLSDSGVSSSRPNAIQTAHSSTEPMSETLITHSLNKAIVLKQEPPPKISSLVWGRFNAVSPDDTVSVSWHDVPRDFQAKVFAQPYILLRQDRLGGVPPVTPEPQRVAFSLNAAYAEWTAAHGSSVPVRVNSGQLSIDFHSQKFTTSLMLSHDQTPVKFSANGTIRRDGMFYSIKGEHSVQGVLGAQGKEAGYSFRRPFESGEIRGITLWHESSPISRDAFQNLNSPSLKQP